jgi:DNA-binding winged helix-turn-helix (wHTH) protein/Tol biopolymer transport system component
LKLGGGVNSDFELGPWVVQPTLNSVSRDGQSTHVEPKAMEVLVCLARQGESVVSKEELLRQVWPATFVGDDVLFRCISELRRALKDDAKAPQVIETIPKRGYRLLAKVGLTAGGTTGLTEVRTIPKKWYRTPSVLATILIAAGVISWGAYRWTSHDRRPSLENMRIAKLTDSGKALKAAISPDGRYVAYSFRDGDDISLRLRQVGARGETQILLHDALPATFSPDGSHLYFFRGTPMETFGDLYEMPILGGPERKVTPRVGSDISFSPDGRQFVYERPMVKLNSDEIRIANIDGGADRLFVDLKDTFSTYTGPAWSPDGRSIVVSVSHSNRRDWVLDVIATSDGVLRQLYSSKQFIGRPRWQPDGKMLIVPISDQQVGHVQLWTVSYPGGEAQQLTKDLANYDPIIDTTRDGGMLATIQWTILANLWVSPLLDPSRGRQITNGEQRITEIFSLGGKIAIVNRADGKLWIVGEDGTSPKLVADAVGATSFTACGPFIFFLSGTSGSTDLMRINEDGEDRRRLATGHIWDETCSSDGHFVYYLELLIGRWKIRRVPIEGGTPIDIMENLNEPPTGIAISPDGHLLALGYSVASPRPAHKIGVIPIAGGPLVKMFDVADVAEDIDRLRWSPDGRALQYLLLNKGVYNLWEQPFAGGPPVQITKFASGLSDFNWSADGKHLLLSRDEVTSDVVLLSNLR